MKSTRKYFGDSCYCFFTQIDKMNPCTRAVRAAHSVVQRSQCSVGGDAATRVCRTFSSDLRLHDNHLETHWRGQLLKFSYKTLREKLNIKPTRDRVWNPEYESKGCLELDGQESIPLFVIRTQDTIDIEWEDGTTSKLVLS